MFDNDLSRARRLLRSSAAGNDSIWFLPCLLVTGLLYLSVRRLKHGWMRVVTVAALAVIGYWLGLRRILLPWKTDVAFSGLVF